MTRLELPDVLQVRGEIAERIHRCFRGGAPPPPRQKNTTVTQQCSAARLAVLEMFGCNLLSVGTLGRRISLDAVKTVQAIGRELHVVRLALLGIEACDACLYERCQFN